MSFKSLLKGWLDSSDAPEAPATDSRNAITSSLFASKRLWIVIAFAGLAWYALKGVLDHDNLKLITIGVVTYLICETVSKTAEVIMNGLIKIHEVKTDIEYEKLKGPTQL